MCPQFCVGVYLALVGFGATFSLEPISGVQDINWTQFTLNVYQLFFVMYICGRRQLWSRASQPASIFPIQK